MSQDLSPEILHDGPLLQLLYFRGSSDFSLVTFDVMHGRANGKTAFASKLALKNDFDLYGIVPRQPCWYPAVEMEAIITILKDRLNRPSIAYGASMGGYGALRYGGLIGCQSVVAFSPQATIDPSILGQSDRRYERYFDVGLHEATMPVEAQHLAAHSFAIFDPELGLDARQAALLPATDQLTLVRLRHTGHKTATAIASSKTALKVFVASLSGDAAGLRKALLLNKKRAVSYRTTLAQACLSRGRPLWAAAICSQALASHGGDAELLFVSAKALVDLGSPDDAVSILRQLLDRFPQVTKYRLELIRVLRLAGREDESTAELTTAAAMIANFPLHWKLITSLITDGQPELARKLAEAARLRWPDKSAILDKVLKAA